MPRASKSCANPLFHAWVQSFHDEKDYRKRGGPPRATGYENALRSIAACTTKYAHPKELLVLDGVGPTCVQRLTERLEDHCARKGIPMPEFKKKERAKKAPVAPKKPARRPKKQVEEDEDSDTDFPASSSRAKKSKSLVSEDDDEEDFDSKDNVGSEPVKRRAVPARAASKRVAVSAPESSDEEF
ncbi:hypothetical protein C8F04DRAFT_1236167 [Mycena alexandri]|uniref:Crossover junction endonuclease MUS81-like HHH domain-containing protein n=1 Tax=Mycena alexandri TaxID=1745969 RepID=A0AAD6WXL2_9AGAR|nr:hypothetical protein C8F04DRAFT_1236167 [Mycena alexandri]